MVAHTTIFMYFCRVMLCRLHLMRMRKLLYILTLPIFIIAMSCGNSKKADSDSQISDSDSCSPSVSSADMINPHQIGTEHTVIGVTLDRAMNSIIVLNEKGDSLYFDYSNIDDRSKIFGSNIGDTVTVKYVTLAGNRDSVTAILRGKRP